MKKILKVAFLGVIALSLMVGAFGCTRGGSTATNADDNGKIIVKFSHVVAESTPKGQAADMFKELAEKYTNGKVEVQVFPNSQLYNDDDVLNAIMQNNVQLAAPATSKVSKLFPQWQVFDLPFAFKDSKQVQAAMEGDVGNKLFSLLAQKDLKGLAMWDNGFKQMSSAKSPLIKPEDFTGQSFRVMSSKLLEAQFKAVDANPQPMPFSEVYSALEQGVIDGQENTLSNIYSKKFYEVQKYMTLSNHGYLGYAVITNKEFWDGLPNDVRQGLEKAMKEATAWLRQNADRINNENLDKIKQENPDLQIHELTDQEKQAWMDKMDGTYDQFKDQIGEDLINSVKALRK